MPIHLRFLRSRPRSVDTTFLLHRHWDDNMEHAHHEIKQIIVTLNTYKYLQSVFPPHSSVISRQIEEAMNALDQLNITVPLDIPRLQRLLQSYHALTSAQNLFMKISFTEGWTVQRLQPLQHRHH